MQGLNEIRETCNFRDSVSKAGGSQLRCLKPIRKPSDLLSFLAALVVVKILETILASNVQLEGHLKHDCHFAF